MRRNIVLLAYIISIPTLFANSLSNNPERESEEKRVVTPDSQEVNEELEEQSVVDEAELEEENTTEDMEFEEDVLGEEEVPVE